MRNIIAMLLMSLAISSTAHAQDLVLKSNEVLGPDGEVHTGASPQQMERLIERAQEGGLPAGVVGNLVFVVIEDHVSFIPVSDIVGKTKESQLSEIGDQVVRDLTGSDSITFEQVQALNEASLASGEDITELLASGGIEGLDAELVAELQKVATETGIDFNNIVAVNMVLETLPDDQVEQLMNDLGEMIDEGFADQINDTITQLSQIEGGLEMALSIDNIGDCTLDAASCEQIQAIMESQ